MATNPQWEYDPKRLASGLRSQDVGVVKLVVDGLQGTEERGSAALQAVALAFYPIVMPFIRRRVSHDEGHAEDVWSETLERCYRRIVTFDITRGSFRTWVFNQAHFALLDFARNRFRRFEMPSQDVVETVGTSGEPLMPLVGSERAALSGAMKRLSQLERDLLWARHVEGLMPHEIVSRGLAGDTSPDTLRVFLSRALEKLRRQYLAEVGAVTDDPLLRQLL